MKRFLKHKLSTFFEPTPPKMMLIPCHKGKAHSINADHSSSSEDLSNYSADDSSDELNDESFVYVLTFSDKLLPLIQQALIFLNNNADAATKGETNPNEAKARAELAKAFDQFITNEPVPLCIYPAINAVKDSLKKKDGNPKTAIDTLLNKMNTEAHPDVKKVAAQLQQFTEQPNSQNNNNAPLNRSR